MAWKPVGAGVYERPFDPVDESYLALCLSTAALGRENWTVHVVSRVVVDASQGGEEAIDGLKTAWQQLRYQNPSIASTVGEGVFRYEIPTAQAIDAWLAESFFVHTSTVDDFIASAQHRTYTALHYFPATSEIVIRMHHWQGDATAIFALLHQLLRHFAQASTAPTFGDEWRNLAPSFSEATRFIQGTSVEAGAGAEKLFADFVTNLPSIGLPFQTSQAAPAGTKHLTRTYAETTARALVEACKARQVSVASAVHAAMTVALQELKRESPYARNYTSMSAFNYRPHMPAAFGDPATAAIGAYVLALPFSRPPADFDQHCFDFEKFYRQEIGPQTCHLAESWMPFISKLTAMMKQELPPGIPPPSQPQISSIGTMSQIIQTTYPGARPVQVEHVEIIADTMSPGSLVYQWSFRGRFFLNMCYNGAFTAEDDAQAYLARLSDVLFQGLGIAAVQEAL